VGKEKLRPGTKKKGAKSLRFSFDAKGKGMLRVAEKHPTNMKKEIEIQPGQKKSGQGTLTRLSGGKGRGSTCLFYTPLAGLRTGKWWNKIVPQIEN